MLLPLLLLLACRWSVVAAFGWFSPCAGGHKRLQVQPTNIPHDRKPRGLAYISPFGGRQQGGRNRKRRLCPGFSSMVQGRRGTTRSGPSSRGCSASSTRAGGIKSTSRLRRRVSMLNKGSDGMEFFCDQCGDSFHTGAQITAPSAPFSSVDPPLAVCRAPDCGVSFSQCIRCKEEYAGCCSAACKALAAVEEMAPAVVPGGTSGAKDGCVEQRLNGNDDKPLAGLGVAGSSEFSGVMETGVFRRKGATVVPARASPSSTEPERTNRSGEPPSRLQANAKSTEARSARKRKRKRVEGEGGGEDLLESYASRHSAPESPTLAAVREETIRSQPGGAHMVSGHLQGELLKLLVKLSGAKRVLDIGTFTGYSALAFAEALPEDGVVVTLESDARAADTARGHFASSEHGEKVRLLLGKAMDGIDQMISDDTLPFDIVFIDADKKRYWDYYDKVLSGPRPLLGPKGMLLADNVLFHELVPVAEEMAAASAAPAQNSESVAGEEEKIGAIVSDRGVGLQESLPGRGDKLPVVVGRGVLPATPRRLKIAESLDGFNKRVKEDGRVEVVMLPLRDGLSVVTWRRGGFPTGEEA